MCSIGKAHEAFAAEVVTRLRQDGVHVELDAGASTLSRWVVHGFVVTDSRFSKIRKHQLEQCNIIVVIGDKVCSHCSCLVVIAVCTMCIWMLVSMQEQLTTQEVADRSVTVRLRDSSASSLFLQSIMSLDQLAAVLRHATALSASLEPAAGEILNRPSAP